MQERQQVDILIVHGQVMTMDAQRRIFADGAIAVDGSEIVAVGRTEDLLRRYECNETWDLRGALARPGFIDAHTHLSDQITRGLVPDSWDSSCQDGDLAWEELEVQYWGSVTPEEEYVSALLAFMEMVRNGTTAFFGGATIYDMPSVLQAARQTGVRGMVGEFIWDLRDQPARLSRDTDACLERLQFQIDEYGLFGPNQRVGVGVMVLGMGTASDQLLKGAKELADRYGVMMGIHQSFDKTERDEYMASVTGGSAPLEHHAALGILGSNLMLIHFNWLTEGELELLVNSGTCVAHCPSASVKYGLGGSHAGKFPEMLERGVPVALGSDSSNWSNYFDVGMLAYLAATIHREARMRLPTITAEQALEMATLNGARVLGMQDYIGALEPGRKADIVIDNCDRPEWHPGLDLVNDLVYAAQCKSVDTVLIDGEVILRDGRFVNFDEKEAYAEIDRVSKAMAQRFGFPRPRWPLVE